MIVAAVTSYDILAGSIVFPSGSFYFVGQGGFDRFNDVERAILHQYRKRAG